MSNLPRIAVVHPGLVIGGGSEACTIQLVVALKDEYRVTIITSTQVNLKLFNEFYNSHISPGEVSILRIPAPLFLRNARRFAAMRGWRIGRYCKKNSSRFDLMFSMYGLMDFGTPSIQYIHDPMFNEHTLRLLHANPNRWQNLFYRDTVFRKAYLRLGEYLADFSLEGIKKNITLVNSDWTGKLARETYGLETKTIYPPVAEEFPDIPWDKREDGFICMGRIIPEKQIEQAIDILTEVRTAGRNVHLHVVGRPIDVGYAQQLKKKCLDKNEWISIENNFSAREKIEFVAKHKYGIHGKRNEPFGITVAEMVKAGCIVWVPKGGGQVEIVDHPDLIYSDLDDAVSKIISVIHSSERQALLRKHLAQQAGRFSTEQFKMAIRDIVRHTIAEKGRRDAGSSVT